MRNAKEISQVVGVILAMSLLPGSAYAVVGEDVQRPGDQPDFVVGSGVSPGTVSLRDPDVIWATGGARDNRANQAAPVSTLQLGATGFTLAPVGTSGDVRWALFNTGDWTISEAATEIPEPAPLAILGLAILGLGFYRRYRTPTP